MAKKKVEMSVDDAADALAGAPEELDLANAENSDWIKEAGQPPALVADDEDTQIVLFDQYSSGGDMDISDISFPALRLAQGLTAEVQNGTAKPGQWVLTGNDAMDSAVVVPLLFTRRRELRDANRSVLCRSADSLVGHGTPGGDCASCPMSKWTENDAGNRVPPPCTFFYSYIVYVDEADSLAVLDFKRTSVPAGKQMNTLVAMNGMGNVVVALHSSKATGARGTFYTPIVSRVRNIDDDLLERAKASL